MLKNTILRILAFALVLAMLASFAVACNGGGNDNNTDGNDGGEQQGNTDGGNGDSEGSGNNNDKDDPVDEDDPVKVLDGVPDMDMMGYEFNVLCRENTVFLREASADTDTGDQVEQAVFDRNFIANGSTSG